MRKTWKKKEGMMKSKKERRKKNIENDRKMEGKRAKQRTTK